VLLWGIFSTLGFLAHIFDCFLNKFDLADFLDDPFEHYHKESSPPSAITQYFDVLSELQHLLAKLLGSSISAINDGDRFMKE
jgi:hypothetical protein